MCYNGECVQLREKYSSWVPPFPPKTCQGGLPTGGRGSPMRWERGSPARNGVLYIQASIRSHARAALQGCATSMTTMAKYLAPHVPLWSYALPADHGPGTKRS